MHAPQAAYEWADGCVELDAFCVSVAVGSDPAEAAAGFAADLSTQRRARFGDGWGISQSSFGNDVVQIDVLGDAVVCVEPNGWAGIDEDRAARLSRAGPYAALYRSVNADMELVLARAGRLVRRFDPLLYDSDGAIPEEEGLAFGIAGKPVSASLALIERLTGVRLSRDWLLDLERSTFLRDPDA
ncbi:MAG TPA: DUF6461 domain-containing protein [Gaiellales bacterium]|nr:DUF6461 domain-containing protein [Gaiellales bacterium]